MYVELKRGVVKLMVLCLLHYSRKERNQNSKTK
jgi:hypothetical protein